MHIESTRPLVLRVTLHAMETGALVAAARWVAEGARRELEPGATEHLRQVVDWYDRAIRAAHLPPEPAPAPPA
jgi:hypothetical protein